jgi:hypothetical protein
MQIQTGWTVPLKVVVISVSVKEDDMRTVANWIEEKDESTTSEFDRFLG